MKTKIYALFALSLIALSCGGGKKELAPDYILYTDEGPPMLNLAYGANVVPPRILAYAVQGKYILAKSRRWDDGPVIIDYYIVKILPPPVEWKLDLVWSGLKENEFDSLTKQLGIIHFEWKYID